MNFEGEKGTENVEKVAKLETLGIRFKEIGLNRDSRTYDPVKNSDDPDSDSKSNPSVKRNPTNRSLQVVLGASGSLVDFVGMNCSGESTTPQLSNFALGEETGASNRILRLETKVSMDANKEETTKEDDPYTIRDEKLLALLRSLRWLGEPRYEKLKPKYINWEVIEAFTDIPPHDVEATSPDMAYPLNKIILKGDWKYLVDIFELIEAGSEVSPDVYPTFVCNRVHKIGAIKDEEKRKRMAGILSCITHLIKYKSHLIKYKARHHVDGVSSTRRYKLPSILAQRFSSLFSETEDERLRFKKQELLMNYVLVLSLFADDFRTDLSDIAKDLRVNPISVRAHYEYLGCKCSKENVVIATLSAPLEFPSVKRKRRR